MVRDLKRYLRANDVQLVHTHNPLANIYATLAARWARLPTLYTKHGDALETGFRLWLRRRCTRLNSHIVAVSEATADTAMTLGEHCGQRPTVIENGVDCDVFQPNPAARSKLRAELNFVESDFVFGSVARLQPVKRHDIQLAAMEPLLTSGLRLAVCGDGPLFAELNQWVQNSAKSEFITMLGNRKDVADVLNALDVFVLSSEREGLPLVILEAMATGTPVIATAVGGIPRVIEHDVTGFLVDDVSVDALRAELQRVVDMSVEQRQAVGEAARQWVLEKYSTDFMARNYEAIYEQLLNRG